ncbi:ribonuclease III [Haliovirga abyssi]|uniref:Ribonuclease 3 n=1 Tax=Haliovirga abyssi TaxID=2996794 RepID=A0AAU9E1W9_9FUSO|nr:ribonuclease III [Haliovirga abyssi]BDU50385.1 ribonuclease 3 [Haliovirga abyssi]
MLSDKKICEFEKKINYTFLDKSLLTKALIHRSYGNEHRDFKNINNEKLELLGDAVLDLIITEYIYIKFSNATEGELAKLKAMIVSEPLLAEVSTEIGIGSYMFLSKGEELTGGRERNSILGDVFEALLGGIYLDSGFENAKEFVLKYFVDRIVHIDENLDLVDYKTILQEFTQKEYKKIPKYIVLEELGPDHNKQFKVGVKVKNSIVGEGLGRNKKSAEQMAARNACGRLEVKLHETL